MVEGLPMHTTSVSSHIAETGLSFVFALCLPVSSLACLCKLTGESQLQLQVLLCRHNHTVLLPS